MISKSLGQVHKVRVQGQSADGTQAYASIEQAWRNEISPVQHGAAEESKDDDGHSKQAWYKGSVDYWNRQDATVDGVLGGYESIHEVESDTSIAMIKQFASYLPGFDNALDCGAGIGRITKKVLKPLFQDVDLVEPSSTQLNEARTYVPEARDFFLQGLQEFNFPRQYDCIWVQWVLCYLTDNDLKVFLEKSKINGLSRNEDGTKTGLIFIKENVAGGNTFLVDKSDNSVMRTAKQFRDIFEENGFFILQDKKQRGMPDELHHIACFVLKPRM